MLSVRKTQSRLKMTILLLVGGIFPLLHFVKLQLLFLAQSLFGRDLTEQATVDRPRDDYFVPHIVDKCIDAVEALGRTNYKEALHRTNDHKLLIMRGYIERLVGLGNQDPSPNFLRGAIIPPLTCLIKSGSQIFAV